MGSIKKRRSIHVNVQMLVRSAIIGCMCLLMNVSFTNAQSDSAKIKSKLSLKDPEDGALDLSRISFGTQWSLAGNRSHY